MGLIVSILAVIGAAVVGRWLLRSVTGPARVLRITDRFQRTTVDAVVAARDCEPHDLRVVRAFAAWERSRAMIRALSTEEQITVAETLRGRGFPTSDLCESLTAYMNDVDRENATLDAQLADLTARTLQRA